MGSKTTREWSIKDIRREVDKLEAYVVELEKKADDQTGKIMPVEYLGGIFSVMKYKVEDYGRSHYGWNISVSQAVKVATDTLEKIWEETKQTHEANLLAIENNKKLFDKIVLIMENIGIPRSHKISKGKKYVDESAGYMNDLRAYVKRDDGFSEAQRAYEGYKK